MFQSVEGMPLQSHLKILAELLAAGEGDSRDSQMNTQPLDNILDNESAKKLHLKYEKHYVLRKSTADTRLAILLMRPSHTHRHQGMLRSLSKCRGYDK